MHETESARHACKPSCSVPPDKIYESKDNTLRLGQNKYNTGLKHSFALAVFLLPYLYVCLICAEQQTSEIEKQSDGILLGSSLKEFKGYEA